MRVRLMMVEECLGTKPTDPDIYTGWVGGGARSEKDRMEEQAVAQETAEEFAGEEEVRGTSVFHRRDGGLGIWDYQIKGFFKDACGALRRADGTKSKDFAAYKTKIDGLVFPQPRWIPLVLPTGQEPGTCERPLRADTAKGPRVSLVKSETVPPGTVIEFEILLLSDKLKPLIREWLDYGKLRGLGAWRNSGKGRFTWEEVLPATPAA